MGWLELWPPTTAEPNWPGAGVSDLAARNALCRRCGAMGEGLHALSPTNGPVPAAAMFVAEAPGRLGAALTGVPLTGDAAGRRFEALLAAARLRREEVFVTNAVLCNPLDGGGRNRPPRAREVANCNDWLLAQISLVRPRLLVTLGAVALRALYQIERHPYTLPRDVGVPRPWRGRTLVALYHPGARSAVHRPWREQVADFRALGRLAQRLRHDGPAV